MPRASKPSAKAKTKAKAKAKTTKTTKAKTKAKAKTAAKKKAPVKAKAPAKKKAPAKAKAKAKAPAKKKAPAKAKAKAKAPAKKKAPAKAKAKAKARAQTPAKKRAAASRARRTNGSAEYDQNFEPYQARKDEEYMNGPQRDHFRRILLDWKSELMQEVDRTVTHMKDEAANFPDPADRATQEEEFSLELRTRDRERKLIKKIDATMELIEQDEYGYCDACGIEIGIQRLEARPTATQCIDCKTLAEIKERQELG